MKKIYASCFLIGILTFTACVKKISEKTYPERSADVPFDSTSFSSQDATPSTSTFNTSASHFQGFQLVRDAGEFHEKEASTTVLSLGNTLTNILTELGTGFAYLIKVKTGENCIDSWHSKDSKKKTVKSGLQKIHSSLFTDFIAKIISGASTWNSDEAYCGVPLTTIPTLINGVNFYACRNNKVHLMTGQCSNGTSNAACSALMIKLDGTFSVAAADDTSDTWTATFDPSSTLVAFLDSSASKNYINFYISGTIVDSTGKQVNVTDAKVNMTIDYSTSPASLSIVFNDAAFLIPPSSAEEGTIPTTLTGTTSITSSTTAGSFTWIDGGTIKLCNGGTCAISVQLDTTSTPTCTVTANNFP